MENQETETKERPRSCSSCKWCSGPYRAGSCFEYYLCHHKERTAPPSKTHLPWHMEEDHSNRCKFYRRRNEEYEPSRKCCACGKPMTAGYVVDGGDEYFCSRECLNAKYTEEEWHEKIRNNYDENYWTEFDD